MAPWAEVIVDGESRGTTPVHLSLPPGRHKIVLRNEDLNRTEPLTIEIESGKEKLLERDWR